MEIRRAKLPKKILDEIAVYRKMENSKLSKIKVCWATNKKDMKYGMKGCRMFYVNLKELVEKAYFGEMICEKLNPQRLFTGVDERDFRVAKILERWDKKGPIDPPEICLDYKGRINFGDGRHRTIVAFQLGEKIIPVLVSWHARNIIAEQIKLYQNTENV
jgi:hypothetical protein